MDESVVEEQLMPLVDEYCAKFENSSYRSEAERYLHFLYIINKKFRQVMEGRDKKIIDLLRENSDLRKELANLR